MLHRIIGVTALLLAGVSNVHAQRRVARTRTHPTLGWQVQTDSGGFDQPSTSLVAFSTDSEAVLQLYCPSGPYIHLTVAKSRVINFYGGRYFVPVRVRFLPDSTVVDTRWTSGASSGQFNLIEAEQDQLPDHPVTVAGGEIVRAGLLTKLQHADTLQAEVPLYREDPLVARFPIQNHAVLEHYLSTCPLPHQE